MYLAQPMRPALLLALAGLLGWALAGAAHATDAAPTLQAKPVTANGYFVEGLTALGSPKNQNFISNAGFVIAPEGVVVVDGLGSPALAQTLLAEIRKLTPKPVTHVIVTHYHADHVYGLQALKAAGAHIIAQRRSLDYLHSEDAKQRLQASRTDLAPWINADTRLVEADTWLDGSARLTLAGLPFVIDHVGPSHTPEDLTVYVPSEKLLFAGDLLFNGRLPFVGKANSGQWIEALNRLLEHDTAVVLPGHGSASLAPQKDMLATRDYLKYLRQTMGQAVEDFVPFEEAYKNTDWSDFEATPMFPHANRMNAYNTYLLMEAEALGKKR